MRNSSSLDWLRFMHTPNDYRVSRYKEVFSKEKCKFNANIHLELLSCYPINVPTYKEKEEMQLNYISSFSL